MQFLSKIASYIFVVITLLTFMVSTTGFTFYTHECQHHDAQKGLISIDECCELITASDQEESTDCCSTKTIKKVKSTCNSAYQGSKCCETDMNYFRLSEWFVGPQIEKVVKCFAIAEVKFISFELDNKPVPEAMNPSGGPPDEALKIPIYRLFHRVKIDPPLI